MAACAQKERFLTRSFVAFYLLISGIMAAIQRPKARLGCDTKAKVADGVDFLALPLTNHLPAAAAL